MKNETIISQFDGLELSAAISEPVGQPVGIVQISHGMAEHKERYFPFMEYLSQAGYVCIIHDHRGHGKSVRSDKDLGYFYTEDITAIVDDLRQVTITIREMYPKLPVYLFSHSMGTLVSRCYIKNYDHLINKLVLCGPPTENKAVGFGLFLAKISGKRKRKTANHLLNNIAFKHFNKDNTEPNAWLSENPDNVNEYNSDPLCGFTFTTNGFINLLTLQKEAFNADDWHPHNTGLPILVIAGKEDPVIISETRFQDLVYFLKSLGYQNVRSKLYPGKKHEILNERNNKEVFSDILNFFKK